MSDSATLPRSALVSDALDALGLRRHTLGPQIRPICGTELIVGRALPVRAVPGCTAPGAEYRGLLRALDTIETGQVVVIATDRCDEAAVWGELCHTALAAAGGLGVVTDGLVRDTSMLRSASAVIHARGTSPADIAGRVVFETVGEPVEIDGVNVAAGDLVVADLDGVAIAPAAFADDAVKAALVKAATESSFRDAVRAGMAPGEAFERFGVL